jgi:hypothetical protein
MAEVPKDPTRDLYLLPFANAHRLKVTLMLATDNTY